MTPNCNFQATGADRQLSLYGCHETGAQHADLAPRRRGFATLKPSTDSQYLGESYVEAQRKSFTQNDTGTAPFGAVSMIARSKARSGSARLSFTPRRSLR